MGNGTSIHVVKDPLLLRPHLFKIITIPDNNTNSLKVADFISVSGEWDWTKINNVLWEADIEDVKRIPLCGISDNDRVVWRYDSKGEYMVRSSYHLAISHKKSGSNGLQSGFARGLKRMWGIQIPNKIKIHA